MRPMVRKVSIMQAGIESNIWYLSCSPSAILLSIVIIMCTKPSIQAKGTQRSKSLALLKVTVHPKERSIIRTSRMESEVECRRRYMKSKKPCQTPVACKQSRQPAYLKAIEAIPIQRLIFTSNLIQLSPSSSFSLCKNQSRATPVTIRRGNSHPYLSSPADTTLSLLRMSTEMFIFVSRLQPSLIRALLQSLKMKWYVYSTGTYSLEETWAEYELPSLR